MHKLKSDKTELKQQAGACTCMYACPTAFFEQRDRLLRSRLSCAVRPLLAATANGSELRTATLAASRANSRPLLGPPRASVWRRLLRRARHAHADVMQMHVPKKLALQRLCSKKLALQRTQGKRLVASAAAPARRVVAAGAVRRRVLFATRRVARRAGRAAAIIAFAAACPVSRGRGGRRHAGAPTACF